MSYFISDAHEYIFYLLELDGEQQTFRLNIKKFCYHNKKYAKKWRDGILEIINSNPSISPDSVQEAENELNRIYRNMIDY